MSVTWVNSALRINLRKKKEKKPGTPAHNDSLFPVTENTFVFNFAVDFKNP
jgi:hypothetical protein